MEKCEKTNRRIDSFCSKLRVTHTHTHRHSDRPADDTAAEGNPPPASLKFSSAPHCLSQCQPPPPPHFIHSERNTPSLSPGCSLPFARAPLHLICGFCRYLLPQFKWGRKHFTFVLQNIQYTQYSYYSY